MELTTKICSKCKEVKPVEEFVENKQTKSGLASWCKSCNKKRNKQWHIDNLEHTKQYYINNLEKIKECSRQCQINNSEKRKEYDRQYRKNNPEKNNSKNGKRRALIRNLTVESVNLLQLYENHKWVCGICGLKIDRKLKYPNPKSISHDHIIPISKGGSHTYVNIQPAHLVCNRSKSAKIINIQLMLQTA